MIYDFIESKIKPNFYYYKKETLVGELIITYKGKKHLFNSLEQVFELFPKLKKLKTLIIDYMLTEKTCSIQGYKIEFFDQQKY